MQQNKLYNSSMLKIYSASVEHNSMSLQFVYVYEGLNGV